MQLLFLGTGTSSGVPIIGCSCNVCLSKNPKDKRFRCSALLKINNQHILIDTGPDIRAQFLKHRIQYINSILITHSHYDHIAGLDELRPYTIHNQINLYAENHTMQDIKRMFSYVFDQTNIQVGGGLSQFKDITISEDSFFIDNTNITPIRVLHGRLPILGYKIGNLAYLTDVKNLTQDSINRIKGIDTLVISCLRIKLHPTHINLEEALEYIKKIQAKKTYFIHMDHELSHQEWESLLPSNVYIAYDGLEINVPL